jgi:uncharacterized protein YdaU (DUF1376 family)
MQRCKRGASSREFVRTKLVKRGFKRGLKQGFKRVMTEQPYMPLFFGDVLKQTLFWTGEERALYVLLLSVQWYSGPLPSDQAKLADALGYDEQKFSELWASNVHQQFAQTERGFINESLEAHREYLARRAAALSEAGRKGGQHTQAKARQARQAEPQASSQASRQAPAQARSGAEPQATSRAGLNRGLKPGLTIPTQPNSTQPKPQEEPEPPLSDQPPMQDSASEDLSPPGAGHRGGNGNSPPPAAPALASEKARASRRMPKEFDPEPMREWASANAAGVGFDEEVAKMRDHQFREAHSDWPAVVRNWLRRARDELKRHRSASAGAAPTRFEQHKRRLYGGA